jgi:methyl-accepting chemotaxis protein
MSKGLSEKFYDKSDKANRNLYTQFSSGNYADFFKCWVEKGYFGSLGYALSDTKENMADVLNREFCVGIDGNHYPYRALKKMGKLDKLAELTAVVKSFVDGTAQDFEVLARKMNEASEKYGNMSLTEKMQRTDFGSGVTLGEEIDALFLENAESVSVLNKLKSARNISKITKNIQEILG